MNTYTVRYWHRPTEKYARTAITATDKDAAKFELLRRHAPFTVSIRAVVPVIH